MAATLTPRQRFVQSFDIESSLGEYRELSERLLNLAKERLTARDAVAQAERQREYAEAQLFVSGMITGKNLEERKAQFTVAAQSDPGVQTALANIQHNRAWLGELEAEMESIERQISAVKLRLQLVDSTLRFLASESV